MMIFRFIISRKPLGSPVTERAIPLAIFQSEVSVAKHYLRRWLKDPSIQEINIREILDWQYYIERLGSAVQKIITIPAALQGLANPVPRVQHPDWLHKKMLEKTDGRKQRKITDLFEVEKGENQGKESAASDLEEREEEQEEGDKSTESVPDIEEVGTVSSGNLRKETIASVTKRKRTFSDEEREENENESNRLLTEDWRKVLGNPPPMGNSKVIIYLFFYFFTFFPEFSYYVCLQEEILVWLRFHKDKWEYQARQRAERKKLMAVKRIKFSTTSRPSATAQKRPTSLLGGFLERTKKKLLDTPWQIIQVRYHLINH